MKLPLVATRIGILSFKLVVLLIIALSILPLIMGGIDVNFETGQGNDWEFTGTSFRLDSPLTVTNNGYYAINDLTVFFTLLNEHGDVLVESSSDPQDIPAGGDTEIRVRMDLDLDDIQTQALSDLIFNGTRMDFNIGVSAKYTMDLVSISIEGGDELDWEPMIENLDVRSEYAYLRVMGDEYAMVIPYTLSAQNLIYGRSVAVMTQFRDAHGFQGNVTQAIELGPDMWEEAVVPIPLEVYEALSSGPQELSASVTLMFLDCSNTATDVWGWNP